MSAADDPSERAVAFALAHGDAAQAARGRALAGALPLCDALAALPEPAPGSPPAEWLPSLALCAELGALRASRVERACAELARVQSGDGGFAAAAGEDARLQLSGSLGGYLARAPAAHPDVLAAVGDFLAARWSPERVQDLQLANLAAFAQYFANALHEAGDEILQWCGRELERGFRSGAFDAPRTAHVLVRCDAHGLPGAALSRAELAAALAVAQQPDGGFGLPGEPLPDRVERTLQALAAWRHLG